MPYIALKQETTIARYVQGIRESAQSSYSLRNILNALDEILGDWITRAAFIYLVGLVLLAITGPSLSPHPYNAQHFAADGSLARLEPPSSSFWLGTTQRGEDVLSKLLYGVRPTAIAGIMGGTIIISIAMAVGVTAGYVGGRVESILMRFTDFVYGVPLIPFAIVLVTFLGVGYWTTILVIGAILWRGSARVLRSQVLQIKERPFIMSARATGASTSRILLKHVLPNIAGMAILFFALGMGSAIIYQANLAFLGVANPFIPSWGVVVRNAYSSGLFTSAWWWSLPAGFLISTTVLAAFLFGRGYERISNTQRMEIE